MEKRKKFEIPREKSLLPGAVLLALLAAVIIYAVMIHAETKALQAYEKSSIYVAAKSIPEGMTISADNVGQYFTMKEMDKNLIPDTALTEPTQVEGLVPHIKIEEGTLLTKGMFQTMNEITAGMKEPVIVGLKAEDLYQVVGGTLRAGDKIHIYKVDEENNATVIWQNIFIQQAFDNVGTNISNEDDITAAQRINVYMDSKDVERLYSELAAGSLRVVKVCE